MKKYNQRSGEIEGNSDGRENSYRFINAQERLKDGSGFPNKIIFDTVFLKLQKKCSNNLSFYDHWCLYRFTPLVVKLSMR